MGQNGQKVLIDGISTNPELNGEIGTIIGKYADEPGRYKVDVPGYDDLWNLSAAKLKCSDQRVVIGAGRLVGSIRIMKNKVLEIMNTIEQLKFIEDEKEQTRQMVAWGKRLMKVRNAMERERKNRYLSQSRHKIYDLFNIAVSNLMDDFQSVECIYDTSSD